MERRASLDLRETPGRQLFKMKKTWFNEGMTTGDNRIKHFFPFEMGILFFLTLLLVLLLGHRATLGVDFTDESYHIANAYKFFLGGIPFKDELFSAQGFALLTKPVLSIFISLTGSTEGLVLKMRWAFLLFQFFVSLFLFSVFRRFFSASLAMAACLTYFCFVPMNLFSLFYVTLGVGFLGIGMGCFYLASRKKEPSKELVLGSFASALSFIAHPVMALPIALMASLISWPFNKNGIKKLLTFSLSFLFLIAIFFISYGFSPNDWLQAVQGSRQYNAGLGNVWGYQRILFALKTMLMTGPCLGFILVTLGLLFLNTINKASESTTQFVLLIIFPVLMFLNSRTSAGGVGPAGYLLSLGWLSFILIWSTLSREEAKRVLTWFLLPAATATLAMSFTSNSGVASTSTGFLPIVPLSLILFISAVQKATPKSLFGLKPYLNLIITVVFVFFFIRSTFQSAFKEPSFSDLTHPISSGPFRGLKTNRFKKDFIEQLQNQLSQLKETKHRILFTCFFPAGYLLTDLTPGYFFIWGAPGNGSNLFDSEILVRVFDDSYPLLGISNQTCQPLKEEVLGKKGRILREKYYEIALF